MVIGRDRGVEIMAAVTTNDRLGLDFLGTFRTRLGVALT